jgi:hypothetical protein
VPILAAVIGGTAVTLFVTAIVANRFATVPAKGEEEKSSELEGIAPDVST